MTAQPAGLSVLPGQRQEEVAMAWQRFSESAGSALVSAAAGRQELALVWQSSTFISSWCIRQPEAFAALLESGELD